MSLSSYDLKKRFVEKGLPVFDSRLPDCKLSFYHLPIQYRSSSEPFISAIKNYHPSTWQKSQLHNAYEFMFINYQDYFGEEFFDEESPEFNVFKFKDARVCIQRDFIGWTFDDRKFYFVTKLEIDDGYFNCMRWVVPGLLVRNKSLVLHSSSFATKNGEAFIFLGASGAGKTTTVKGFADQMILGDDMNVVSLKSDGVVVQSGAIGGQIVYPHFDQEFKLIKMNWLKKNQTLSSEILPVNDSRLFLLGSVANVFFGIESNDFIEDVINLVDELAMRVPMYQLSLKKGDVIWPLLQKE